MLSLCLQPLSGASGSNLLQQSMTPAHAEVLFARSQNAEKTTKTFENTQGGQGKKKALPRSQEVKLAVSVVGGAAAPGIPTATDCKSHRTKISGQGRPFKHKIIPETVSPFCYL